MEHRAIISEKKILYTIGHKIVGAKDLIRQRIGGSTLHQTKFHPLQKYTVESRGKKILHYLCLLRFSKSVFVVDFARVTNLWIAKELKNVYVGRHWIVCVYQIHIILMRLFLELYNYYIIIILQ